MSKILYFCNCDLRMKNGHGLMIRAHHKMLNDLFPNSIITVMMPDETYNTDYLFVNHASQIEKFFSVLSGYSPDLSLDSISFILRIIKENMVDTIFIESSMFGNLIRRIKSQNPSIKVVTYFTDIEADLLKQELSHCNMKRKAVIRALIRNEEKTVKYADKKFVLNRRDADLYLEYYGKKPDAIIPIIVSKRSIRTGDRFHIAFDKLKILFVGGDFWPNVAGIRWFIDSVLPSISVQYELVIVGMGMERYKAEMESKSQSVHVVGTVDDLSPYFLDSDLFIAPINEGGGMKVKTAEALSYGKTFLGLKEALTGYWEFVPEKLRHDGIIQCDDAGEMAQYINSYYAKTFPKCREDIKNFIESICGYEENIERFKKLFV